MPPLPWGVTRVFCPPVSRCHNGKRAADCRCGSHTRAGKSGRQAGRVRADGRPLAAKCHDMDPTPRPWAGVEPAPPKCRAVGREGDHRREVERVGPVGKVDATGPVPAGFVSHANEKGNDIAGRFGFARVAHIPAGRFQHLSQPGVRCPKRLVVGLGPLSGHPSDEWPELGRQRLAGGVRCRQTPRARYRRF